jgi:plasmid maintenance system killer protein
MPCVKVTSRVTRVPSSQRSVFYDCVEVLLAAEGAEDFDALRRGPWRLKPLGRRTKDYSGLWSIDLDPAWRLLVRFNRSRTEATLLSVEDYHR